MIRTIRHPVPVPGALALVASLALVLSLLSVLCGCQPPSDRAADDSHPDQPTTDEDRLAVVTTPHDRKDADMTTERVSPAATDATTRDATGSSAPVVENPLIPPLDARAPAHVETACFAVG